MSPVLHVDDIKAALILVGHDRDDLVIPVGDSRRLASLWSRRAGATYTEYAMFQHADPMKRIPHRLVRELRGFTQPELVTEMLARLVGAKPQDA
jgi:hypothetical protein